ncbi:hypothetical protein LPJ72_000506 [Coemansia sp. Benny D160-2]|nr:hypothetical protein LPJ72_000506 [Coemansia sp. Benny D160-2]
MRIGMSLWLLAATASVSQAFVADKAESDKSASGIKTFAPYLKHRTGLTVYETPVAVKTSTETPTAVGSFAGPPQRDQTLQGLTAVATAYLSSKHGIDAESVRITDAYTDKATGITHVYARQTAPNGKSVVNGVANININAAGEVISSSNSFAPASALPQATSARSIETRADAEASLRAAFSALASYVKTPVDATLGGASVGATADADAGTGGPVFAISGLPENVAAQGMASAAQALLQREDGTVVPVWQIVLRQGGDAWWSAHVNSGSGSVEAINNWVSSAAAPAEDPISTGADQTAANNQTATSGSSESFRVFPRTVNTPDDGSRTVVKNPADTTASRNGWVSSGTTTGNNVWAQNNPSGGYAWKNNHRPNSSGGTFDFALDLTKNPSAYVDAAITQLFYTVNTMHDLSYLYGFDEAAGNFQDVNYSGSGVGGDYVVAFAQDGSGTNNANFATPPDGQNGVMRMYVWTQTNPYRDGDLEQDIVAHEYTHGISTRLTGGPANSDCLADGEAGGMGEGWSDTVANLLRIVPTDTRDRDIIMGEYSYGSSIRNYPYSTSLRTNPETYAYLDKSNYREVHAIGEVWATILYEVMWNLMDANGISDDLFDHDLTKGNSLMLQLLLDAMKLQPCNPSFLDARTAIVQAENNLTRGKNKCAIWRAFAKRGLGTQATSSWYKHYEDYSVPSGC